MMVSAARREAKPERAMRTWSRSPSPGWSVPRHRAGGFLPNSPWPPLQDEPLGEGETAPTVCPSPATSHAGGSGTSLRSAGRHAAPPFFVCDSRRKRPAAEHRVPPIQRPYSRCRPRRGRPAPPPPRRARRERRPARGGGSCCSKPSAVPERRVRPSVARLRDGRPGPSGRAQRSRVDDSRRRAPAHDEVVGGERSGATATVAEASRRVTGASAMPTGPPRRGRAARSGRTTQSVRSAGVLLPVLGLQDHGDGRASPRAPCCRRSTVPAGTVQPVLMPSQVGSLRSRLSWLTIHSSLTLMLRSMRAL